MEENDLKKYEGEYSESKLTDKLANYAKVAGLKLVYLVLIGKALIVSPKVPITQKGLIIGALGYFILPVDLIPDFMPAVGYGDDLMALMTAIVAVSAYIDDEMRDAAKVKLHKWFGDFDDTQLDKLF
ncbi:MAG: DUF1232 domain-containing protein [Bacteroidales bacterium]